mmetsp:Transcript_2760/g.5340  ORF Transcript_2760/g.5340 Transcript_2760/m.5340 type:complete len:204 (+) Transcript_2760:1383-1994(+)
MDLRSRSASQRLSAPTGSRSVTTCTCSSLMLLLFSLSFRALKCSTPPPLDGSPTGLTGLARPSSTPSVLTLSTHSSLAVPATEFPLQCASSLCPRPSSRPELASTFTSRSRKSMQCTIPSPSARLPTTRPFRPTLVLSQARTTGSVTRLASLWLPSGSPRPPPGRTSSSRLCPRVVLPVSLLLSVVPTVPRLTTALTLATVVL